MGIFVEYHIKIPIKLQERVIENAVI